MAVIDAQAAPFKVGFVYGTPPNDLSWTYSNDLARAFLEFSRPNIKTKYVVTPYGCGPNTTEVIRNMARGDFDLVVTASSVFENCTMDVAREFPNKHFLCIGGGKVSDNYASAFGRLYEARYVNGIIAGLITKNKRIGFIGSLPIYQDFTDANAVLLGAKTVCPDCKMVHYYAGDFYLPAEDEYAARQLIEVEKCDVLFVLHDAFTHIDVALQYGVPTFGADVDQSSVAPEIIVTSAYWVWGPMLLRYVDALLDNSTWLREFTYWGLRENGVGVASIDNVNRSVALTATAAIPILIEKELVDGYSYIFCGSLWEQSTQSANVTGRVPLCLRESDILIMDYFMDGVDAKGFVKIPVPVQKLEYVHWKSAGSIIVMLLASLGILLVIACFLVMVVYRNTALVRMSHMAYITIVSMGFMLSYAMVFTYMGALESVSCVLRPWLGGLGFVLIFAPMIAKNYRLARILKNTALISTVVPMKQLLSGAGVLVAIETILLVLWTGISSARLEASVHSSSVNSGFMVCRSKTQWIFIGIQFAYVGLILVMGTVLAFIIRRVANRVLFREALWINYAFINAAVWFVLWALGTGFLWDNYKGLFALCQIAMLLFATSTLALTMGPKLYVLFAMKGGRETHGGNSGTQGGSSDFSTDFKPEDVVGDGF